MLLQKISLSPLRHGRYITVDHKDTGTIPQLFLRNSEMWYSWPLAKGKSFEKRTNMFVEVVKYKN